MTDLFGTAAIWPAEKFINYILNSDSHVKNQISKFAGKCLEVHIHSPNIVVTALFETDRISLSSTSAEELNIDPDGLISGEAADLVNAVTKKRQTPLANDKIRVAGDAQFVQDLYVTIQSLDIQWADFLSPVAGDVISNEVDQITNDLRAWSSEANKRLKRNLNDYIVEEARYVPHSSDVEKFNENLDALRLKIDRVNAKAELLYQRLEQVND
ncbi:MAG: hypothetical protein GKR91_09860 [Pseudomonadales bacterium]|nr:hypothetical protein [Pseudomonadales bacterium]